MIGYFCFTISGYFNSVIAQVKEETSLKVLVITGTHGYDKVSFNTMFNSFNGMECTIKEMGEGPASLFEDVDKFPYDVIVTYNFKQRLPIEHRKTFEAIRKVLEELKNRELRLQGLNNSDRCKSSTLSPQICHLPLIQSGSHPEKVIAVHKQAQIHFNSRV